MKHWSLFTLGALTVLPVGVALMLGMWIIGGRIVEDRLQIELEQYVADSGRREASTRTGPARCRPQLSDDFGAQRPHHKRPDRRRRTRPLSAGLFPFAEMPGIGGAHLHLRDYRGRIVVENTAIGASDDRRAEG